MKKHKHIYTPPLVIDEEITQATNPVLTTSVKGFRPGYDDIILDEWED